jgi:molybdate transport system substrate-binding protein
MIKNRIHKCLLSAAVSAIFIAEMSDTRADDLVILSAAAVRPALVEVPALFAKATGHRVKLSFGNATAVETKVKAGEPADLLILPMAQLHSLAMQSGLGMVARAPFGLVRLGIAVKANATKPSVTTAAEFKEMLLSASSFGMPDPADGSTSSTYLVKLMEQLEIAPQMTAKTKLFPDGTKALEAVAKGDIVLTIAPVTSICTVPGVALVAPLPEQYQLKTAYFAALTNDAADSEAANQLMTLLFSDDFAEIMKQKCIDVQ